MSPLRRHISLLTLICAATFGAAAQQPDAIGITDSTEIISAPLEPIQVFQATDTTILVCSDTIMAADDEQYRVFNPDPTRATWLSVLCPGLGQIYNRRYWKLPIVVGAYMGLAYATSWNNTMLTDYTKAYNDLMDNDPDTKSYMNFFAPGVNEASLNQSWLQRTFQSRKNYFRRNRDLCIVGMIGVYLVAIVDAYVDASLAHFDISPNLSLEWAPTIMKETRSPMPSIGVQWALCF